MKKFISFLSGVVVGGLVGATFALLFAPSSGKQLQERLKLNAEELKNEISLAARNRRNELQAQLDNLRQM
jgi:gas vesicle protein